LLTINFTTFPDATLVTLSWLHMFLDAMSQHKLLAAWTAALEGRDSDIPAFDGIDFDPLATLGDPISLSSKTDPDTPMEEPYILAPKAVSIIPIRTA
jgi:hypothetical protein